MSKAARSTMTASTCSVNSSRVKLRQLLSPSIKTCEPQVHHFTRRADVRALPFTVIVKRCRKQPCGGWAADPVSGSVTCGLEVAVDP